MWSFDFVIPTFLILVIILFSYFSLPRLNVKRNWVFLQMIVMATACIVFDILSSMIDNEYAEYPIFLTYLLNMLFFISFYLRAFSMFTFTASILRIRLISRPYLKHLIVVPLIVCIVLVLLSPLNGLIFYIDETGYHSGPLYFLLYLLSFFYLGLSFGALIVRDKVFVRRKEFRSLVFFNCILMAGLICRYMMPRYLLMDTFCLMAILVVYLNIINPEFCLDQKVGTFNRQALADYIDEHVTDRHRIIFGIIVHKYGEMLDIYGSRQLDSGLSMIGTYLTHSYPEYQVFYVSRGRYVIVGNSQMDTREMREDISLRFKSPWRSDSAELYLDADYAVMEPIDEVPTRDQLLNSLSAALDEADAMDDHVPVAVTEADLLVAQKKVHIKRCFEEAVEHDNIEVFLQPLIDAASGKVIGAEALSRIRDTDGSIVPPSLFIPVAENSGKINNLGEQVFEKTCRFIKEYDPESLGMEWINVNLSPLQFLRSDLAERFSEIALKYDIDPGIVHLEITEESMVDEFFFQKQIEALSAKGFQFVLDDYGTGYSNLTRLKKCPFISIKLDMEVVWDFCKKPDEILPMMIQAFKHMGFLVTAEGIENERMVEQMKGIGCDYFQGFFYSKPVPTDEFIKNIRKNG